MLRSLLKTYRRNLLLLVGFVILVPSLYIIETMILITADQKFYEL